MELPETNYARSGDVNIAYQVVGNGPLDLVYVPGWVSNVEFMWGYEPFAHFLRRLSSFSRLILFDKRGTGLSDHVPTDQLPTLEQRMDDVRAVLDAVGSERAALFGHSEGGNMCLLFAATYPERVSALALLAIYAKRLRSEDYPWAPTPEQREAEARQLEEYGWGEIDLTSYAPSRSNDPEFKRWLGAWLRNGASPRAAAALLRMNSLIDVRDVLPTVSVPTLMLHRVGDRDVSIEEGRYIAERIPGARLVELPGDEHPIAGGDLDRLADEIEEFLTGVRPAAEPDRVLATVVFTDIVGSTDRAVALGDRAWRDLLDRHHAIVRRELERHRGREVDTAGDGFLATFDGPARAVRCACAIREALRELGLEVRAGVHTGEVQLQGEGVAGVAVHTGARVSALAGPGEVLVSRTVTDLTAGSGLVFEPRGEHELKGVPGTWQLYAAVDQPTLLST
jgi:class 3 adenylate cyclase/alpha-beta hydrolase superfamily lysophospholipase